MFVVSVPLFRSRSWTNKNDAQENVEISRCNQHTNNKNKPKLTLFDAAQELFAKLLLYE